VIAHEVRNPLMIIKASLHTLRQPAVSPESVREAAADIDGEITRLNRVVNDVLDFARPIQFDLAPVHLNALCRESAAAAEASDASAPAAPGVSIALALDPGDPILTLDAERLRVALIDMILNARHAVAGQPAPRVTLATSIDGERVSITIADTGPGIAPADLARIFDPYFTTKRGGTGLGLPISKNIVEGLGGAIAVSSMPGRGTEIRIDFPVGRHAGAEAAG
jgi:signal transduction histidine kinase